jgi:glycosyltransferase involved in cell wall biosynthesis
MSALVKVIVPCYGYAELLEGCVASVLEQEGAEVRVLIVDDCSPDATDEVAARLSAADERVEARRNPTNLGLIASANAGLEWAADSDYVVLLSADDRLAPGALGRAVEVMEARPRVGLVYGHAPYFEADERPPRLGRRWRGTTVRSGSRWIELRCRRGHNCMSSPEVVVRTAVQRRVGGYDPACQHASDLQMWLRIAAVSDVAYIRGAAQALYRVHRDSMLRSMLNDSDGRMVDLRERRAAFETFFAVVGERPELVRWRRLAGRALARQALWQASRAYDRGAVDGPGAVPVEELVAFALETCPEARRLREWWGLRLRKRIGAGRSLLFLPFIATGAAHRLRGHLGRLRWRAQGV